MSDQLEKLLKGKRGWDLSVKPPAEPAWKQPDNKMSGSKEEAVRESELVGGIGYSTASGENDKSKKGMKIKRSKSRHATAEGQRKNASSLREAYEKKKALIPRMTKPRIGIIKLFFIFF